MGTLYTFGCSMTHYRWPTWADLLAVNFNEYQNWGLAGAGNKCIFESFVECIAKNDITADDQIWIMWTSAHRFDYIRQHWKTLGSVFSHPKRRMIMQFWDEDAFYFHTFNYIMATQKMAETLPCKVHMMSMIDVRYKSHDELPGDEHIDIEYPICWDNFLCLDYISEYSKYDIKLNNDDPHPTPAHAGNFLRKIIAKNDLNLDIDKELVDSLQTKVVNTGLPTPWDRHSLPNYITPNRKF